MNHTLEDLSLAGLKRLQGRVDAAIARFDARAKVDVWREAEQLARKHGFSLTELLSLASPKSAFPGGAARFRSPTDASITWTGRGRRPDWFKAHLAGGGDPESLLIR